MLARTLGEARRKWGWSVLHFSKRSGVSGWAVEQIENASPYYVPSEGNTVLLAEALKLPVGCLTAERDRLVDRLRPRARTAAIETQGVNP